MKKILILSTNTNVGKTTATLALMREYSMQGIKTLGFKPIETGVDKHPKDAYEIFLANNQEIDIDYVCPIRFQLAASPYVANKAKNINWNTIFVSLDLYRTKTDIVLIESAGGACTPIDKGIFNADLAKKLDCDGVLLVCHSMLGCLSDAIVYSHYLKSNNINFTLCVNRRQNDCFDEISAPFWLDYFGEILELRRDIKEIARRLNGNTD